jgi:enamine deaminase RidA (YjgF/YER057c/UK114 family)
MNDKTHSFSGSPYEAAYGFSRAVRLGDRIEVAGTAPIVPEGQSTASTAFDQMMRCGEIMITAIEDLGGDVGDIVRTRMFITDPADADEIGRAHKELFGVASPASTMVVVASLLDPSWKVETEAVAVLSTKY